MSPQPAIKQLYFTAALAAVIFPIYAFFGDAGFSLLTGLFIGMVAALLFFEFIGLNGTVVIGVIAMVLYLLVGEDAFYLFGLVAGIIFCLIGLYALSRLLSPQRGRKAAMLLLVISAPVAFSLGAVLIWTGVSELGLLPRLGLEKAEAGALSQSLPPLVRQFTG